LWFTEWNGNKIGRVTVDGTFSEYALPTPGARPQGIAEGRDGALWFTEAGAGKMGRINL
jgi:virginiamycin B lyase